MQEKIILTDVDGVLLDWNAGFDRWMMEQGYVYVPGNESSYLMEHRFIDLEHDQAKRLIREFNESEDIGNLVPLRDSIAGVRTLRQAGYKLGVITSHSDVDHACARRELSLRRHFTDVFAFFVHLPTGSDKDHVLDRYRDTNLWWVEDKTENALAGRDRGLRAILFDHEYNSMDEHEGLHRVHDWRGICNLVLRGD